MYVLQSNDDIANLSRVTIPTCQCTYSHHRAGNAEDRYLGSAPCRVLISSDSLTELIIMYIVLLELEQGNISKLN